MRSFLILALAGAALVLMLGSAAASHSEGAGYADNGIPADEERGLTAFPRGDVFTPLLADPKTESSFASYLHGTSATVFGTEIGAVGVGERFGLFRWNGPTIGEGVQIGLSANVYAQFDLWAASFDLINTDYVVGLPVTFRRGPVSARVRVYHQSSHLGDEFVLRSPIQRENISFESVDGILAVQAGAVRVYAGGENVFTRRPGTLVTNVLHGGAEFRPAQGKLAFGRSTWIAPVAGLDVKSARELDWAVAWSARAGFEFRPTERREHRSRRWRLLAEYYDGPSPYGQFLNEDVSYWGVGLQVGM